MYCWVVNSCPLHSCKHLSSLGNTWRCGYPESKSFQVRVKVKAVEVKPEIGVPHLEGPTIFMCTLQVWGAPHFWQAPTEQNQNINRGCLAIIYTLVGLVNPKCSMMVYLVEIGHIPSPVNAIPQLQAFFLVWIETCCRFGRKNTWNGLMLGRTS